MIRSIDLNHLFPVRGFDFPEEEIFDVAVIGAGVVGTAIFKAFAERGAKALLVERANDILDGASKGNSAILHTGFDAPPGTLEHACVRAGYEEYKRIHKDFGLPIDECGALVVAWNDEQLGRLEAIRDKGIGNGVENLELVGAEELRRLEPGLSDKALGALRVCGESLVDPWSAPLAYFRQGLACGGKAAFSCPVESGEHTGEYWELRTPRRTLRARKVINAAGLYGDIVDRIKGSEDFRIIPRKGQFIIFDKSATPLIRSIILPVPTARTKGVVVTRTAFGNILVGPTAEDQESRSDSSTVEETLRMLHAKAAEIVPELARYEITATFAGLRPASDRPEYRVMVNDRGDWITAGGIRSTGLTSALGLARHIVGLAGLSEEGEFPARIRVPNISEFAERDHRRAGYGEMICHCETVTRREIEAALKGEGAAGNLDGLKRRTRATMGRCQGFNCLAELAELIERSKKES